MSNHTRGIDLSYRPSSYFWARERADLRHQGRRAPQALRDGLGGGAD
jgi:hypothetical protein